MESDKQVKAALIATLFIVMLFSLLSLAVKFGYVAACLDMGSMFQQRNDKEKAAQNGDSAK